MTGPGGQDGASRPALPASAEKAGSRLLVALAGGLAIAFASVPLALVVRREWPPLVDTDRAISAAAEDAVRASDALLAVARAVTLLGDPALLWIGVLAVSAVLASRGHTRAALFLLAVRLGAQLLSSGLKVAIGRSRPVFEIPVDAALGASFPSGHTLGAAAVWTALALVVLSRTSDRADRLVLGGALVVAVLVAASRVLLGVHYPSDVVGGLLLGVGWTAVCAAVFLRWRLDEGHDVDPFHEGVGR